MTNAATSAETDTTLVLHIGTPKTGTTYLQGILAQNRAELAEKGWSYPSRGLNQQHAIYGICGSDIHYLSDTSRYRARGEELLAYLASRRWPHMLLSAEVLAQLDDGGVERLLRRTGAPDKVVMTLRGLHTLLPSMWQQLLKAGHTATFAEYIDRLAQYRDDRSSPVWLGYAFGDVVRRWSQHAKVHVVVVPTRAVGRDQLWHPFREAAGLPAVTELAVDPGEANVSLSAEAAEVLRRLNGELRRRGKRQRDTLRQHYLQQAVLPLADTDGGARIVLPPEAHDRVRRWNEEELDAVSQYATAVHGDLTDASFQASPQPHTDPATMAEITARQLAAMLAVTDVGDDTGAQRSDPTSAIP